MLYRIATIGVAAFWLVMMGLLIRVETHPGSTDILEVPVSYVVRIMFRHGQQSFLSIYDEDHWVGTIAIHPKITPAGVRSLDFSGAMSVQLPMTGRQRLNFEGVVNMDIALRMLDFRVNLLVPRQRYEVALGGNMARNILTCAASQDGHEIMSGQVPMSGAALTPALSQYLGMAAVALPALRGNFSAPSVVARETQTTLHGEQLDAYQISVREGTTPIADLYVTQLGQLVMASTNFGYRLSTDEFQ